MVYGPYLGHAKVSGYSFKRYTSGNWEGIVPNWDGWNLDWHVEDACRSMRLFAERFGDGVQKWQPLAPTQSPGPPLGLSLRERNLQKLTTVLGCNSDSDVRRLEEVEGVLLHCTDDSMLNDFTWEVYTRASSRGLPTGVAKYFMGAYDNKPQIFFQFK